MKNQKQPQAPGQQKGGSSRGGARRAKQKAARTGNISRTKKVRTRTVQDKKDANVFRCSKKKYRTVAEMQRAVGIDPATGRKP